ncbi:uncharacterized protein BO66DRAFT_459288 [Aspergillus aculeatinus CBS 121060]|uniref:Uncharacterized protein n=1 Tax=Aspergillus aculeatinus CBS 121060 TaxID=1448322 RepID=A0ACD1GZL2_9EURO|nr:hypothetical protein BO66DRAFT_459288 [Aspergillus aculeatinus CBS 121060]RAH66573.1 hypothetical protein BO66DRAFT_459288 [Aspergillus aculeatinus CBS 121060]
MPSSTPQFSITKVSRVSILDLPPEILGQIFQVCLQDSRHTLTAILLTCQRFYPLALPIQYHDLKLSFPCQPQVICLHRTLQSNQALALLVRSLVLDLRPIYPAEYITIDDYTAAADVLTWCRAVRILKIWGVAFLAPKDRTYSRTKAVSGQIIDLSRWEILKYALRQLPSLRRIELATEPDSPVYGFDCCFDCRLHGQEELQRLPGTGRKVFEAINERARKRGDAIQSDLITFWPVPVQSDVIERRPNPGDPVDFCIAFGSGYATEMATEAIVDKYLFSAWLKAHSYVLRRIILGHSPLAAEFHAARSRDLRTVTCPGSQERFGSPSTIAEQVLPTVPTFVWNLSFHEMACEDFGEREEDWLRGLAKFIAVATSDLHPALRTIQLNLDPDPHHFLPTNPEEYPWDRITRLEQELRVLGLELKYTPPSVTREEYEELCRVSQRIDDERRDTAIA